MIREDRGFPQVGVPLLGVPMKRIMVFGGSTLGSPYFGELPDG